MNVIYQTMAVLIGVVYWLMCVNQAKKQVEGYEEV
jgi:hypothetical protein